MATSWKSQRGDGKYYLQFETDDKEKYRLVEKAAQMAVDGNTTADVVEVKYGEWLPIVIQDNYLDPPYCDTIKCSECGETSDVSFHDAKYCYMCGAKMDGGGRE